MPLVRIEILKGKDAAYKRNLLEAVHDALVAAIGIADWDRFQRLYELEPDCFERAPEKTDNFTIIEITLFPGRTRGQKKAIIEEITRVLHDRLGIVNTDVFIVLQEPPNENWGLGGKAEGGINEHSACEIIPGIPAPA